MYCDLWSGIWGFVSTERGAREAGRGNTSRMCTVTAVWMTGLWKAQPKGYSRGQSSFGSLCTTTFALLRQPYPLKPKRESNTNHTVHLRQQLLSITQGLSTLTHRIPGYYGLPVDDFFTLSSYEMLFLRGQDAQRVLLACPGLSIDDIRALVHIDCTLG